MKAISNTSNKVSEGVNSTRVVHGRRTNAKQLSNASPSCDFSVRILEGEERSATLARFASLHYRAGLPSTCIRVLAACDAVGDFAGILCVSMPTLNAPWRIRAWPELFGSLSHTSNAATVNLYVRTISRVIVAPTYRGSGIASLLIRAYLDNPMTPLTETLAAFGRFSPLFERCGMRRINFPASRRDTTLAKALRDRRIVPWKLVSLDEATRVLDQDPALRCAVLAWARGSKSTRRFAHERTPKLNRLLVLAAAGLVARPAAFVAP